MVWRFNKKSSVLLLMDISSSVSWDCRLVNNSEYKETERWWTENSKKKKKKKTRRKSKYMWEYEG